MRTHIETLADACPRSRRRVRATLGLDANAQVRAIDVEEAQYQAFAREQKSQRKVK